MNILVTGGAGYIGSHCCKALARSGFLPVCFDNLTTGHLDFIRWGPNVVGDIRDEAAVFAALQRWKPAAVMHFAAASSVGESVEMPDKYYDNNVRGTVSLLNAMQKAGCHRIIFSSSGAVYGDAKSNNPLAERDPCRPINPYGRTKWMAEQILADYRAASLMRPFSLRYFNASGADSSGVIGERRAYETHLIPLAMRAVVDPQYRFSIFGDDYETPDGTAVRDYIHVNDLADAHLLALKLLLAGHSGDTLNLGSARGYSVKEILVAIEHVAGHPVPHRTDNRRPGDPAVLIAATSEALRVLGFTARHDLTSIVSTSWQWYRTSTNFSENQPCSSPP